MTLSRRTFLVLAGGLASGAAQAQALAGTGVVLVHGKGANQGLIEPVAAALRAEGARVVTPRMSWAGGNYRPYEQTLAELNGPIAGLRRAGVRRIVLAGQSLGANLSLAYAARSGGVGAVVAMAPGHRPSNILRFLGDSLCELLRPGRSGEHGEYGAARERARALGDRHRGSTGHERPGVGFGRNAHRGRCRSPLDAARCRRAGGRLDSRALLILLAAQEIRSRRVKQKGRPGAALGTCPSALRQLARTAQLLVAVHTR
jgi:pimeloyl-ACP methyl ester carboxylesterase